MGASPQWELWQAICWRKAQCLSKHDYCTILWQDAVSTYFSHTRSAWLDVSEEDAFMALPCFCPLFLSVLLPQFVFLESTQLQDCTWPLQVTQGACIKVFHFLSLKNPEPGTIWSSMLTVKNRTLVLCQTWPSLPFPRELSLLLVLFCPFQIHYMAGVVLFNSSFPSPYLSSESSERSTMPSVHLKQLRLPLLICHCCQYNSVNTKPFLLRQF